MKLEGKIEGVNEFEKVLKQLPKNVQNRVLQRAVLVAMRVARPVIKSAAPVDKDDRSPGSLKYGRLKTNIRVVRVRARRKEERGAILNTGMAAWGYWLEKGTRYIAAHPWFTPAWSMIQEQVIKRLGMELGAGIEKEAERLTRGKK